MVIGRVVRQLLQGTPSKQRDPTILVFNREVVAIFYLRIVSLLATPQNGLISRPRTSQSASSGCAWQMTAMTAGSKRDACIWLLLTNAQVLTSNRGIPSFGYVQARPSLVRGFGRDGLFKRRCFLFQPCASSQSARKGCQKYSCKDHHRMQFRADGLDFRSRITFESAVDSSRKQCF